MAGSGSVSSVSKLWPIGKFHTALLCPGSRSVFCDMMTFWLTRLNIDALLLQTKIKLKKPCFEHPDETKYCCTRAREYMKYHVMAITSGAIPVCDCAYKAVAVSSKLHNGQHDFVKGFAI